MSCNPKTEFDRYLWYLHVLRSKYGKDRVIVSTSYKWLKHTDTVVKFTNLNIHPLSYQY